MNKKQSLISPRHLSNFETGAALITGSAYWKINNIKCRNLVTFSFKTRMKQIFTITKLNIIKNLNINHTFIVLSFAY